MYTNTNHLETPKKSRYVNGYETNAEQSDRNAYHVQAPEHSQLRGIVQNINEIQKQHGQQPYIMPEEAKISSFIKAEYVQKDQAPSQHTVRYGQMPNNSFESEKGLDGNERRLSKQEQSMNDQVEALRNEIAVRDNQLKGFGKLFLELGQQLGKIAKLSKDGDNILEETAIKLKQGVDRVLNERDL